MDYLVGRVVGIEDGEIIIQLHNIFEDDIGNECGVPDSMQINIIAENGPQQLIIGQPGSYMQIDIPYSKMLVCVVGIKITEAIPSRLDYKVAEIDGGVPVMEPKRILTTIPVGTYKLDGSFEQGVDIFPTVNASVYAATPELVGKVYSSYSRGDFSIGRLSILPEQDAYINLDSMIGRHCALLGQTGGGKSWTISTILQKICTLPRSTSLLLDLHGEYRHAFGDYADYISAEDIELPFWLMNFNELVDLCVDRKEASAPNEIAKFRELLQQEKESTAQRENLEIPKITVDTPVYFDFDSVIRKFDVLDTEMKPGANPGKLVKGDYNGQFTRMLMRIRSRLNDKRYDLIFRPQRFNSTRSLSGLFARILGEQEPRKKLVVLDISPIPFDVRNSIISLILRLIFDFAYWHRRLTNSTYPIFIACDEGHVYLNNKDESATSSVESAERISKEGRKYGVGLMVISQRPREISSTILSQCSNFICLRITNPDDQMYVKGLLPDSTRNIVDMLASLRRGEGFILGDSVIMPTRVKFSIPDPTPDSNDVSFRRIWGEEDYSVDIEGILDEWRRQGVKRN